MPYDLTIPLLYIYPEKTTNVKDTCAPLFILSFLKVFNLNSFDPVDFGCI